MGPTARMRICLFTATFLPKIGGHEMAVDALAKEYIRQGHDAIVLAQHASRRGTPDTAEFPYAMKRFAKPFSQFWGIGTLERALRNTHREHALEVVHSFSSYPTGFAAVCLKRELGLPVVVTSQGGDLAENSRFSERRFVMKRIRRTLAEADAVTAISAYMKSRALAICPECAPRLRDIPNGVNTSTFSNRVERPAKLAHGEIASGRFFLFLGRLHPRKGIDVLIDAFRVAAAVLPDISLVIAGDGPEMASLRAQAEASGATDRVHFLGMVEGSTKIWLLQNALSLIAPTRTWEGMPVGVLEGMAAACPVIGSRVGGITDLIEHEREGLLTSAGDAESLSTALVRIGQNRTLRDELGQAAQRKAQGYDWSKVAEAYLELFDALLRTNAQ